MKGNKKILVAIALLLLLSVCFTTYAIYRSSNSASGTVSAAGWSVKVGSDNLESATIDLTPATADWTIHNGKNGKIAPGDSFTKTITIDATGSEVDVLVSAELSSTAPSGFDVTLSVPNSGVIEYNATSMTADVTVTVTWNGALTDNDSKDTADKTLAGTNISIPVTLTARQNAVGA